MFSAEQDDRQYRRGMVLGLTMAEVIILIIFILLLTLSLFVHERDQEIANRNNEIADLVEKNRIYSEYFDGQEDIDDLFSELVLNRQRIAELEATVATLTELVESQEKLISQLEEDNRNLEEIWQLIDQTMATGEPDRSERAARLREILEEYHVLTEVADMLENAGMNPSDPAILQDVLKTLGDAGFSIGDPERFRDEMIKVATAIKDANEETERLREQVEYFRRVSGFSNEMPPCWIHPETKRAEYIFDVSLTSGGIRIYDLAVVSRREERASLPIGSIVFEQEISEGDFVNQTESLFQWSEENECRFFVRIFDLTGATEKDLFIRRLLTVERHFYKFLVTDPDARPGD